VCSNSAVPPAVVCRWKKRMTVCNMSDEAGSARRAGSRRTTKTYEFLAGRNFAAERLGLGRRPRPLRSNSPTDEGATYDKSISIDADTLEPMITFGNQFPAWESPLH